MALQLKEKNKENCNVMALYIMPEISIPSTVSNMVVSTSKIAGERTSMEKYFKELYARIKDQVYTIVKEKINVNEKEIALSLIISHGNVAEKIIEFSEQEDVDLIIMGLLTKI